jgi:hypothetical protein
MAVTVILFFGGIWYTISAEKERGDADKLEKEIEKL